MVIGARDKKKVIKAFIDGDAAEGHKLSTDGKRLDGSWMGGRGIAEWSIGAKRDHIVFNDLGSRAAQTVQRAVAKLVPASWLAPPRVQHGVHTQHYAIKEAGGKTTYGSHTAPYTITQTGPDCYTVSSGGRIKCNNMVTPEHMARLKKHKVDATKPCPKCGGPSFATAGGTRTCLDCYHEFKKGRR